MKYKIIISFVLFLFVTGCALQKPIETKPSDVQIENGTVFLINTDGNKTVIATSKPEDGTTEGHFSQYTYTKAELSPNKQFVALYGFGWEKDILRVYDIKTNIIHDVSAENLYPLNYTWTRGNLLTGTACPSQDMNLCSGQKTFISLDSLAPWLIGPVINTISNEEKNNISMTQNTEVKEVVKTKKISFDDTVIYIETEERGNNNQVILEKAGRKFVLDKGYTHIENQEFFDSLVSQLKIFNDIQFNQDGSYLLVTVNFWEASATNIFDLIERKEISTEWGGFSGTSVAFSTDGKFVYGCETNTFSGSDYGKIVSLDSRKIVFELPEEESYREIPHTTSCSQNTDTIISFTIDRVDNSEKKIETIAVYDFDVTTQTAKKKM